MSQPAEKPVKDVNQIIRYLSTTFNRVTASKLERAVRDNKTGTTNEAYIIQTEFAYLLNEVVMGPRCTMQKSIVACNEFLDMLVQELASVPTA
jgi:hypothetical protein